MGVHSIKTYSISEIDRSIKRGERFVDNENKSLSANTHSLRLKCLSRSNVCCFCGVEGNVYSLDVHTNRKGKLRDESPHLNMYSIKGDAKILMTADHIVPRSRGGANVLSNLQTMCVVCNSFKGNKLMEELEQINEGH